MTLVTGGAFLGLRIPDFPDDFWGDEGILGERVWLIFRGKLETDVILQKSAMGSSVSEKEIRCVPNKNREVVVYEVSFNCYLETLFSSCKV